MARYEIDDQSLNKIIARLDNAISRAQEDRKKFKALIEKAEEVLTNHGQRIATNEEDIATGKTKLQDHENRIKTLEGG